MSEGPREGRSALQLVREPPEGGAPAAASAERPPTLEEAFRAHAPYVARLGMRLLGRREQVEDLVQDVFVEAAKGLHALRQPAAVRGWLARVTVRLAFAQLRRRRLRHVLYIDRYDYSEVAEPGASPLDKAVASRAYQVLDGMSAAHRLAWTLRHVEGEPLATVAQQCGCSLATAKRWIGAAAEKLKKELGDEGF